MSRPPILLTEPEVQERLVGAIRAGNYLETAAAYAGVHPASVRNWLRRGAAAQRARDRGGLVDVEEAPYWEFFVAVTRAEAEAEVRDVTRIVKAGERDWRAVAWRLEHRNPDRWGRQAIHVDHDLSDTAVTRGVDLVRKLRADPEQRRALDCIARGLEGDAGGDGGSDEPGDVAPGPASGADL